MIAFFKKYPQFFFNLSIALYLATFWLNYSLTQKIIFPDNDGWSLLFLFNSLIAFVTTLSMIAFFLYFLYQAWYALWRPLNHYGSQIKFYHPFMVCLLMAIPVVNLFWYFVGVNGFFKRVEIVCKSTGISSQPAITGKRIAGIFWGLIGVKITYHLSLYFCSFTLNLEKSFPFSVLLVAVAALCFGMLGAALNKCTLLLKNIKVPT